MSITLCPTDLQNTKKPGYFFLLKRFFFAFFLIPKSRIICKSFYNSEWYIIYQLDFIFIMNIRYNKFIRGVRVSNKFGYPIFGSGRVLVVPRNNRLRISELIGNATQLGHSM